MRGADQLQPGHIEHSERVIPPEDKMTVAEYILSKLNTLGISSFHTVRGMEQSPLVTCSLKRNLVEPMVWDSLQEAIWAGQSSSRCSGFSAIASPECLLYSIFEGLVSCSYQLVPLLFIVQRSLRPETKELCGLPLSIQERGRKEFRVLMRKFSACSLLIDDRRTAPARIDRAIDTSLELLQPVVIELPDEVAGAYIAPHAYRKTVFNYEDQDVIKCCWHTILSRLEQAHSPLFVLGQECWPPLWHHTLLILGSEFQAEIIASETLFGHLGSYQPEGFRGYVQLNTLSSDFEEAFDSIFVFGVPSDSPWLETVTTHHDLAEVTTQELLTLNSSGVTFGDGREFLPSPCLNEFFCHAPLLVGSTWPQQGQNQLTTEPPWYPLVSLLKDAGSPLFAPHDNALISFLIRFPPFAKLFIQPENADDSWLSVSIASFAKADASCSIFVAGNSSSLSRAFGRLHRHPVPHHLIFLLYDTENSSQEVASLLSATILSNEQHIEEWLVNTKNIAKHPGLIWISPDEDTDYSPE